jgi:hypothetical protein
MDIAGGLTMGAFSTRLYHSHLQTSPEVDDEGNAIYYIKACSITMSGCLGDTNSAGTELTSVSSWYNKIDIDADKTEISGDLSVYGACTIGKWNAHTSLIAYADTTVFGSCNISDGDASIKGSQNTNGYWTGGGSLTVEGDLTLTGAEYIDDDGFECFRPSVIYGKKYSKGIWRGPVEVLVPQDENGDLLIGRGVSSTFSTTDCTRLYGYDVYLYSRAADLSKEYGVEYRPYYRRDDSIDLLWYGGGFVSNSSTTVYFSIPLAKPAIGNPTVTIENINGICVRQGGHYCYGGTASDNYVIPSSYEVDLRGNGTSVRIKATMPNTTNAINNETCGIAAYVRIKFS